MGDIFWLALAVVGITVVSTWYILSLDKRISELEDKNKKEDKNG